MGETTFGSGVSVCTGGTNESGFAITNTTCYESVLLEAANVNTELMEKALENCKTLAQFEDLVSQFTSIWSGKNISGIFAVIDAYGGAAIYEMWSNGNSKAVKYRKYNADTGLVTDENGAAFTDLRFPQTTGFLNRTNSNHANGFIQIWSDTPRELRARQLLQGMKDSGALSPRNIMRVLSKDVLGGDTTDYCSDKIYNGVWTDNGYTSNGKYWFDLVQSNWDASADSWNNPNYEGELFTRYAISRYQTSMGLVIEGAATEEQAKLTTMWVALCEPSLSVFVPYYPYAGTISKYATDDKHNNSGYYWDGVSTTEDKGANSFLNLLFDCVQSNPFSSSNNPDLNAIYKNISLYYNNGSGVWGGDTSSRVVSSDNYMDNTINYPRLVSLQEWTLPLEDIVIRNTNLLMAVLRDNPELVTRELLAGFSDYCNSFVYKNYSSQSASFLAWDYVLPEAVDDAVDDEEIPGDYNDPGNEDPYYGDDDYEGEGDYSDPGSLVKNNPSSGGGCGMSAFASSGRINQADRLSGFISLMITMLFPLCMILMHRVYRRRRD
ncbi:MAG TPA: hypothetical protein PK514_13025 [Spirochaetota bacterium]|nr:hypothetical protein [Spirochaetota bacterium]